MLLRRVAIYHRGGGEGGGRGGRVGDKDPAEIRKFISTPRRVWPAS